MSILVAVLLVLLAVLVIVLVAPVTIGLHVTKRHGIPRASTQATIRWLVWSWNLDSSRRAEAKARRAGRRAATTRVARVGFVRAAFRTHGFSQRALRLARQLLPHLLPRDFAARARVGLDDPADTGRVIGLGWALLGSLSGMTARWPIHLEPDFGGPTFEADIRGSWVIRPGSLLAPLVAFALSPVVWRFAIAARRQLP